MQKVQMELEAWAGCEKWGIQPTWWSEQYNTKLD
jgi:hypothetical protein